MIYLPVYKAMHLNARKLVTSSVEVSNVERAGATIDGTILGFSYHGIHFLFCLT